MTREAFFDWAEAQSERYEFDGFEPVAMTGSTVRHSQIAMNLYAALRERLRGGTCRPLGPDAGLRTVGDAVRYPDALVTCTKVDDMAREVPGVVAVFEVLNPLIRRHRPHRQTVGIPRGRLDPPLHHHRIRQRRTDGARAG